MGLFSAIGKYAQRKNAEMQKAYVCNGLAKVLEERGYWEKGEGNYYRKTEK